MFEEDLLYSQPNTLQEINCSNRPSKKGHNQLHDFLNKIDEEHDSEDEGIEDYKLGGYHPIHIGEVLLNRYVVIQKLGWGHFSTVWLCRDFKYRTYVAIKVQKSSPHYMQAAFDEVEILQKVQALSGKNRDTHVVGLLNAFIHKTYYGNHFCMVFEILRCNLLQIIKRYNYEGIPLETCRQISKQVLQGLDFLHRVCGVIHTDLKPENVMVCLSAEELKEIVENGQLVNNQLFAQRTRIIQKIIGVDPAGKRSNTRNIENRLKQENLTKNQKKTLKKKLKKQKEKENEGQQESSENMDSEQPTNLMDLFDMKKGKISFNRGQKLKMPFTIKIADLGNACWKHHHFSTQIQTRQYRSPEVILGQSYNQTADIWSFGCMMYELLTGDLLFHPRQSDSWSKNEDHLAQMQELVGPFHPHYLARSPKRHRYFQKDGSMRKFPTLTHYPFATVLQIKNKITAEQAKHFADFLMPTLIPEPELRISAAKALQSPWFNRKLNPIYKMSEEEYTQLRDQFNLREELFHAEIQPDLNAQSIVQDSASGFDEEDEVEAEIEENRVRMGEIKMVDRSFTDLGYLGYDAGIELCDLDTQGNWQFST